MEVPIFASKRVSRRQGHGGVLFSLLIGVGRRIGLHSMVIAATDESRAFWIKQGCHTTPFCAPSERTALRALHAAGLIKGFSNSVLMARGLGDAAQARAHCAAREEAQEAAQRAAQHGRVSSFLELMAALARCGSPRVAGLSSRRAQAALSFVDISKEGNFWLDASGERKHEAYSESEQVSHSTLDLDPSPKPRWARDIFIDWPTYLLT